MTKRSRLPVLLAAIGVSLPAPALWAAATTATLAESGGTMGEVGVGVGVLSEDSYRLGRFTGVDSDGLFPDLSVNIFSRSSYLAEDPYYWRIEGQNLGLDSQSLMLSAGSQGRYSAFLYYREMPNLILPDAGTPYRGTGGTNLSLPPDGGVGTLGANLREIDIETERQRLGLGGRLNLTSRWRASTAFHHERKEGTKVRGIGEHWGLQRATLVPAPVDYETRRVEADLTYDGERFQSRLGYMLSTFSQNGRDVLNVADAHAADWSMAAIRQDSLEPDNRFHQISGSIAYSLGESTRLGADVQIGRMQQDSTFIQDGSVVTDAAGNLRRSLDGDIDTKVINLHADTRPHERLTLRAAYRNDERDNNTPELLVDAGPLVTYTVGFQCAGSTCVTRPISFEQQRVNAEADWRVTRNTFLTLGYTHDERDRTYEDRETTEEQTVEARLRTRWAGSTLTLNVGSAEQTGSNWERDTLPVLLRKYYLADRDRTIAGAHLALALSPRLQTSFRAQWMSDDYTASELGLTSADRAIFSWDAAYFPTERLQTYAFYSMEVRKADQSGIDGTVPWTADREDNTYSFGIGGEYTMIKDVLKLGMEATLVETFGKIDVVTATGVGEPYPDLRSTFGLASVYGDWKLSDRMAVRMRYMYERYEEEDWGINGVGVTGVGDLILLQQSSPDYAAHIVAATLRYRF